MGETKEQKATRLAQEAEKTSQVDAQDSVDSTDHQKLLLKDDSETLAKTAEDGKAAEETHQVKKGEESEQAEVERNKVEDVSIKGVVLKGSASQKVGSHSVHLTSSQIVNFVDGKADVREDVELALKNAGFIE